MLQRKKLSPHCNDSKTTEAKGKETYYWLYFLYVGNSAVKTLSICLTVSLRVVSLKLGRFQLIVKFCICLQVLLSQHFCATGEAELEYFCTTEWENEVWGELDPSAGSQFGVQLISINTFSIVEKPLTKEHGHPRTSAMENVRATRFKENSLNMEKFL